MSTDSPRRSARSKSPSDEQPVSPPAAATATATHSQKTADQLAEERERRRERLLAGRDSRLTKIVSSVGGTNFTPPSNIASPANIVTRREGGALQGPGEAAPQTSKTNERAPAPAASAEGSQPARPSPLAGPLADKLQTVLILVVNVVALVLGHWLLGQSCLKALFKGDCKAGCRCDLARSAYFGLLVAATAPIMVGHVLARNYPAALSSLAATVCLSVSLLVLVGHFIDRL